MNFLKNLFSKKSPPPSKENDRSSASQPQQTKSDIPWDAVQMATSPNGQYVLWCRNIPQSLKPRKDIDITEFLLSKENNSVWKILHEGRSSPTECAVSDNGRSIFLVLTPEKLQTTAVFVKDNGEIHSSTLNALPFCCAISINGRYCAVSLCNSEDEDGGSIVIFDWASGERLSRWHSYFTGFTPFSISYDGNSYKILFHSRELGDFSYSLTGEADSPMALHRARLDKGDYATTTNYVLSLMKKAQSSEEKYDLATECILALQRVQSDAEGSNWNAEYHKAKGICLDVLKREQEALAEYRKALEIKPKIGVKRRFSQLSKKFTHLN